MLKRGCRISANNISLYTLQGDWCKILKQDSVFFVLRVGDSTAVIVADDGSAYYVSRTAVEIYSDGCLQDLHRHLLPL